MAFLYVTEYESLKPTHEAGAAQVALEPCVVDQTPVAIGGSSAQSLGFGKTTKFIRLNCDTTCSVNIGPATAGGPTATTNNRRLPANSTEYFGVQPGYMVAVIANS